MLKTFAVGLAAAGILLAGCSDSQKQNAESKASQAASALPSVLDSAGAKASDLKSKGADAMASASGMASEAKDQASSMASDAKDKASQAAGQVGDAVENLKIQLTDNVDQAKAELQRLKDAGVYNTDAVKYSDDPVTALKQLKDRLDQGLVDLQGQLTEKGKQVLGGN
ncbi:hypothetical protein ACIBG8_33910 [Nonomuraea sp. NPDC050556]|uniref:hypothetical protein n=1 Tax=Nonomuraea sp. NPDC050556 TaxID=3364369 RepID=UPI0037B19595